MRFLIFTIEALIFLLPAFVLTAASAVNCPKESEDTIKIGLLIPDNKSAAARQGAEIAIREANSKGGVNGQLFSLIVRSMEGPWGTGSRQAVNLIFDHEVYAIMGSHDGRNAHLVEQAATKSRVVFLSAWTGDPTLTQAFVPWFFSCVPNYNQQADALIREIYNKGKFSNIAVISDRSYDSRSALRNFLQKVTDSVKPEPFQLFYDNRSNSFIDLLSRIKISEVHAVVIFVEPPASLEIIRLMRQGKMMQPVFGFLALIDENNGSPRHLLNYENIVFVSSVNLSTKKGLAFSEEYKRTYGILPGDVASYAYDGMSILIEAIRNSGPDREKIQQSMAQISFDGVTGIIQFDEKGNRKGTPGFVEIKNGIPVSIK